MKKIIYLQDEWNTGMFQFFNRFKINDMLNEIIKMIELSKNTKGQDWRHNINQIKIKINEYAKEYHESKVKKLNIPDVMAMSADSFVGRDEEDAKVIAEAKKMWSDTEIPQRKLKAVKYMMEHGWGLKVAHDYCQKNFG